MKVTVISFFTVETSSFADFFAGYKAEVDGSLDASESPVRSVHSRDKNARSAMRGQATLVNVATPKVQQWMNLQAILERRKMKCRESQDCYYEKRWRNLIELYGQMAA